MFLNTLSYLAVSLVLIYTTNSSPLQIDDLAFRPEREGCGICSGSKLGAPTTLTKDPLPDKRAIPEVKYFYNIPGSQYEDIWNDMESKGFRMTSLSIYGPHTAPRFAVVYKKENGPRLWSLYNVNEDRFKEWVAEAESKGYTLTEISATGERDKARFAVLAEKVDIDSHHKCDLTSAQVNDLHQDRRDKGWMMKTVRQYGSPSDRRYCVLFHGNPAHEKYTFWRGLERDDYVKRYNAELTKRYWHPEFLSISEDDRYSVVFSNVYRGSTWSDSKMTARELDDKVVEQANSGRYLHTLQGSGSGSGLTFAALWSSLDVQPRVWRTRTGADTGVSNNFKNGVRDAFEKFMKDYNVRQAQFAIGRNSNLNFERAFTWSEDNRATAVPSDRFYLASVSKPFAAAAAQVLFNANLLSPNTKIVNVLSLPETPADTRFSKITVQQLIDHTSGLNQTLTEPAAHDMRRVALDMSNGAHPATTAEVATWIARRRLAREPGASYEYSNQGYQLLGRVIELASGREYMAYLRSAILTPENLDVDFWATNPALHEDDRIVQEDWRTGLSTLFPRSDDEVARVFGGGGRYFESSKSMTSLTASASTLTRFASRHAVRGNGGRTVNCMNGSAPGARTSICSAANGYDWAVVVSTRDFPLSADGDDKWDALISNLKALVNAGPA
jgi:CubicO group peptidase (beta-lactamase class C family)